MSCWLQLLLQLTFMASGFGTSVVARAVERSLMLPSEEMDRFIAPGSSEMGFRPDRQKRHHPPPPEGSTTVAPKCEFVAQVSNFFHRSPLHPPRSTSGTKPTCHFALPGPLHCTATAAPARANGNRLQFGFLPFFPPHQSCPIIQHRVQPEPRWPTLESDCTPIKLLCRARRKTLQRLAFHSHRSYGSPVFAKRGEGKSKQHIAP